MTDVTSGCSYKLISCRDAKLYMVTTPNTTVGGDTFTVDGTLKGLKLTTVGGVLLQRSNSATASATYNGTTVTISSDAGTTARSYTCLVWGTD